MKRILLAVFIIGVIVGYIQYIRWENVSVETIRVKLSFCANKVGRTDMKLYLRCLRTTFTPIMRPKNVSRVMQAIEHHVEPDQIITSEISNPACHEIGHVIGEIVSKRALSIPYLFNACGSSCGYGCAHGVAVGLSRINPKVYEDPDSICSSDYDRVMTRSDAIACHHGVGHAYAEYASYDINRALSLCARFGTNDAKLECTTGVFMEIFHAPTFSHDVMKVPDDGEAFCTTVPVFAKNMCVHAMATSFYTKTTHIADGIKICKVLSLEDVPSCVNALGADIYFIVDHAIPNIIATCLDAGQYVNDCLSGAVMSSLVIDSTGKEAEGICNIESVSVKKACTAYLSQEKNILQEHLP